MGLDSISVYICTYNEEENIEDCIKSIVDNGIDKIFIVDASLNDDTANIARQSGADVINAPKGLAGQRQIAIDHCSTKFLMFVDADDRLDKDCIQTLYKEMIQYGYDAVQAKLRIFKPKTYWQKGMDANLAHCISLPGPTNMVGRPALYKTNMIKKAGADLSFNNIGNEDAAISIRMEKIGAIQGIGNGIVYRFHPETFKGNIKAWRKYGYGDANLIRQYPNKTFNVLKHVLYIYPIKRTFILFKNGKGLYSGFTVGIGWVRFYYIIKSLILDRTKNIKK